MSNRNKGKANYSLAWLCVLLFIILTYCSTGLNSGNSNFHISLTADTTDTPRLKKSPVLLPQKKTTILPSQLKDSVVTIPLLNNIDSLSSGIADTTIKQNKVDSFSFKISKDTLDGPVVYHADDSMILDVPGKKLLLYGKLSTIKYADNELAAPQIEYDQRTNLVKAFLKKDSTGKVISFVSYNQGDFKSVMDSIEFNMKTGKGLTKGTYTQQGEIYIYGEKIKREDQKVFYAGNARFTTCNLDTPHFAFVSKKIKFISGKMAFTGPVHPEFEGVPIPVVLPFGIFPLSQGRHSGFLRPTFTANQQLGLSLEGMGYYKILSPNWDIIGKGTLYSYGGWTAQVNPRYYKRYHFQGSLVYDIQRIKYLDQPSNRTMHLAWTHTMDTKARPGVTFGANVNISSSKYNQQVPNSPARNFSNQLYSSISYAKIWKDKPYNIAINGNHDQNTNTGLINLRLPDISFNLNTLYPFRRKEEVSIYKWYENIGIGLNTNAKSISSFYDTLGNIGKQIADNLQYGAIHRVPITLSLPPLGVFQVSPTVSYEETWYQRRIFRKWNPAKNSVDTASVQKGFYTARSMNFGIGVSTRIFGMYNFKKSSNIIAIRHEIRPTISASYTPDLTGDSYYRVQTDSFGFYDKVSVYQGNIFGPYSNRSFGGLNFTLDNNVTMKVKNRKDTAADATKKISLLDGLTLQGSYNFLQDSFQLSILSLSARTNLFDKINLTANASFDPYQRNQYGRSINKFVWARKPISLGTLMSANISLQSGFKGGDKSHKSTVPDLSTLQQNALNSGVPLDEYQQEAAYIQNNPGQFVDFEIPWSVTFTYAFIYSKSFQGSNIPTASLDQSTTFDASANLTQKWKLGVQGSFNITQKELGLITMYLSRDLHCWQMSVNVSRSELSRFVNISISPKSAILRDLKVNRTRYFSDF